ncbi:MAG: lysyl oxidase family protein [Nocardioides sp.]
MLARHRSRLALAAATLALAAPAVGSGAAQALPDRVAAPVSPITLWAPSALTVTAYGQHAYTDLGLRVIAQGAPFELWSHRPGYDHRVQTVWHSAAGDVSLPDGSLRDLGTIRGFLSLTITPRQGEARTLHRGACLNSWSERVHPDAPAYSPYPQGCYYNPYSLGSVQGVQDGWASPFLSQGHPLKLAPGRYTVTASIDPRYATPLGLAPADATRTIDLRVVAGDTGGGGPVGARRTGSSSASPASPASPASHRPAGVSGGSASGPVPDLRALPAWGIQMARNGNYLNFSATVWNAGDSPLVVDGFRRDGEDLMDAYQYFFDSGGNQTGYQQVGQMHWDPRPTHQHWHFEDFARYVLLRADKSEAVRSRKEAFCLANTDAVDQTVPGAAWKPDNTDLSTACGDLSSLSIREVLASGWGDTYGQFRAGQSFDLKGLPNGTYYVAVLANPDGRLVESDTTNNTSLRKVIIRGTLGHRTVTVPQVGLVVEPDQGGGVPVD